MGISVGEKHFWLSHESCVALRLLPVRLLPQGQSPSSAVELAEPWEEPENGL